MKQIKTKNVDLRIDKYKLILGHNYEKKDNFLKQLQASFQKKNNSDFQEEVEAFNYVKINEREINLKENILYSIHPWIDLDEELKMGSKSLFTKHIEALLMDIEFDDHYMMLRQVINLFEDETLNTKHDIGFDSVSLRYKLNELSSKIFLKLIEAQLYKENCQANALDLTYDEMSHFIIKIVNEIAKQHVHLDFWVLLSKRQIDKSLIDLIESTQKNVRFLIDTERIMNFKLDHVVYFGNIVTDFSDPEQCYEQMVKQNLEYNTLEEFRLNTQQHIEFSMNGYEKIRQL